MITRLHVVSSIFSGCASLAVLLMGLVWLRGLSVKGAGVCQRGWRVSKGLEGASLGACVSKGLVWILKGARAAKGAIY